MTTTSRQMADLTLEVTRRMLKLAELLEEVEETGAPFNEEWAVAHNRKSDELLAEAAIGSESAIVTFLKGYAVLSLATECSHWLQWQAVTPEVFVGLPDEERTRILLGMLLKQQAGPTRIQLFNPMKVGPAEVNLWFARQDRKLFEAGVPHWRIRSLREHVGDDIVSRKGATSRSNALLRRARKDTREIATDFLLPARGRILLEVSTATLREWREARESNIFEIIGDRLDSLLAA